MFLLSPFQSGPPAKIGLRLKMNSKITLAKGQRRRSGILGRVQKGKGGVRAAAETLIIETWHDELGGICIEDH